MGSTLQNWQTVMTKKVSSAVHRRLPVASLFDNKIVSTLYIRVAGDFHGGTKTG